ERAQSPARRQRPSLHRFECAYPNLVNGRSLLYPSGAEKRAALPRALPVYWLPTPRIASRQTYPQGSREYRSSEIPAETAQIPGLESVPVFFGAAQTVRAAQIAKEILSVQSPASIAVTATFGQQHANSKRFRSRGGWVLLVDVLLRKLLVRKYNLLYSRSCPVGDIL